MSVRPPFSESAFLAAVFSPKKNPAPKGLRKTVLKSLKGRKATRVKLYNSMSALNQKILVETKQRDAYLRGEVSITDAKRELRQRAVDLGVARPLRARNVPSVPRSAGDIRTRVLDHLWTQLTGATTRAPVNIGVLRRGTLLMTSDQLNRSLRMAAPDIKQAAGNPDEALDVGTETKLNPFWYH